MKATLFLEKLSVVGSCQIRELFSRLVCQKGPLWLKLSKPYLIFLSFSAWSFQEDIFFVDYSHSQKADRWKSIWPNAIKYKLTSRHSLHFMWFSRAWNTHLPCKFSQVIWDIRRAFWRSENLLTICWVCTSNPSMRLATRCGLTSICLTIRWRWGFTLEHNDAPLCEGIKNAICVRGLEEN